MNVFVGGMPRSGSTFSFNVARMMLSKRGSVSHDAMADVGAAFDRLAATADHVIIKSHEFDERAFEMIRAGELKCIITIRKPEDAIASWMQTFGFDFATSIATFSNWLRMFQSVRSYSLVIDFEKI